MRADTELISLISLIDDPDMVVRDAVRARLVERGEEALDSVERFWLERLDDLEKRERYQTILDGIKAQISINKLEELLKSPQPLLERGLFLISKIVDPSSDETIYNHTLEELSDEVNIELSGEKTPVESVKIFNYIFYRRFRFKHTDTRMHDPYSALIDRVLLSRAGNPVTVSLAYFLLSRSAGLPVYPLSFPGGFVPVYVDNQGKILFYLNIFKQGSIFLEDTLVQFFKDLGMDYDPQTMKIDEERALISMYSQMLGFVYNTGDRPDISERLERVAALLGHKGFL